MEIVIKLILILASIDLFFTLIWIYRWQSSKCIKKFKTKLPVNLFEANPIINHTIKYFGTYKGTVLGYFALVLIQIAIASLHNILAWIVFTVLVWAIQGHIRNNIKTSNKYIIEMTKKYNEELK